MTVNNNDQTRIARAGQLSLAANREFLSQNRELLVYFSGEAVSKSMSAIIRLEHADEIRSAEPNKSTYLRIQERAFLAAFDRGAVVPLSELSSLAWDAIERMRRDNGQSVVENAPTPEPTLTPQQKLEFEIKNDWSTLPTKQIRQKMANDKNYRDTVERISNELRANATSYVRIGE
jgi:hypothetical protein